MQISTQPLSHRKRRVNPWSPISTSKRQFREEVTSMVAMQSRIPVQLILRSNRSTILSMEYNRAFGRRQDQRWLVESEPRFAYLP